MTKIIFLLALLPLTSLAAKDEPQDAAPGELVSRYWLDDPIVLGGTIGFPNHLFTLSSGHGSGTDRNIDYSPPQTTDFLFNIGFGPWQFAYKIALPQSSYSRNTYGAVDYSDFAFEFGKLAWAGSLYYQSFTGFYTDLNGNTGSYARIGNGSDTTSDSTSSNFGTAPDIQKRPDIRTRHFGAVAWHAFPLRGDDPQAFKISLKTMFDKPEPGFNLDFVHNFVVDHAEITGASVLVPAKKADSYGKGATLLGVNTNSVTAGAGLVASYVFDSRFWSVDSLLLYGGGVQRQRADFLLDHSWKTVYADNFNFRLGVNYKADMDQLGLHFWVNTMGSKVADVRLSSSNMSFDLSYVRTI